MRVALIGYGKMGKALEKSLKEKGHSVGFIHETSQSLIPTEELLSCDVAIEFTGPENAVDNLTFCAKHGIPVVSGTTGWLEQWSVIQTVQEKYQAKILYGSNFSLGVQLFLEAAQQLAHILKNRKDYELHIEETHHTEKKDAPSGTAISLFQSLQQGNPSLKDWSLEPSNSSDNIHINAIREEHAIGNHKAIWEGKIDHITLEHHAKSRQGFVQGAIDSSEWLLKQSNPGLYSVRDVLGLT